MSARETVVGEALGLLRRHCDERAEAGDIMLFGRGCEVCSPLPQKYSLDNIDERIYNISKELKETGSGLFCDACRSGGYIVFILSEGGLRRLIDEYRAEHPVIGKAAERIEVGCSAGYIHAVLLHIINTSAGGFHLPRGIWGRRALWLCMMAKTPSQRSLAMEAAFNALEEHRRLNSLCAETAAVMAAAALEWF